MTPVIGVVAAALTMLSFVAQARKILRTRDVHSLSTRMWILTTSAFTVWTAYGVLLRNWPIVIANTVCGLLSAFILALKLMSPRRREAVAEKLTS